MKGRITEELGRVTRNRRLQRRGKAERVSGSLKQAVEKAKDAFRRNGSGPR
ncbi:CsbD family protein [Streptomyces sp. CA-251387]|uniref:CsbD family protein n=1 Tax=Streptomyces sp. CA-251387 TaxID=3240064 RepID=UPI003D8B9CCE